MRCRQRAKVLRSCWNLKGAHSSLYKQKNTGAILGAFGDKLRYLVFRKRPRCYVQHRLIPTCTVPGNCPRCLWSVAGRGPQFCPTGWRPDPSSAYGLTESEGFYDNRKVTVAPFGSAFSLSASKRREVVLPQCGKSSEPSSPHTLIPVRQPRRNGR